MHKLSNKLLTVFLTLLLVLSPLQGVLAAYTVLSDQGAMADHAIGMQSEMHQSMDLDSNPNCDQCTDSGSCSGQKCSSIHCASCTFLALLSTSSISTDHTSTNVLMYVEMGFPPRFSSSLFRPPKA